MTDQPTAGVALKPGDVCTRNFDGQLLVIKEVSGGRAKYDHLHQGGYGSGPVSGLTPLRTPASGAVEAALREARKWVAGQPDRSTSIYETNFAMLEAIDAALTSEPKAEGEAKTEWRVSVGSGPYGPRPFDNEAEALAYFDAEMAVPSYMGSGHRRSGSVVKVTTISEKVR